MSWKRSTRAVAWGTLIVLACTTTVPSTSAAFPIKEWFRPQIGDPDVPGTNGLVIEIGQLILSLKRFGSFTYVLVPSFRSRDRLTSGSVSVRRN